MEVFDVAGLLQRLDCGELVGAFVLCGREFLLLEESMVKLRSRGVHINVFKLICASLGVHFGVLCGLLVFPFLME
jgi:hypothetical protein